MLRGRPFFADTFALAASDSVNVQSDVSLILLAIARSRRKPDDLSQA
jgi:hypothetical protein